MHCVDSFKPERKTAIRTVFGRDERGVLTFDPKELREDLASFMAGQMNLRTLINGYVPQHDPVEFIVRDHSRCRHGRDDWKRDASGRVPVCGRIKSISRSRNLRVTMGRDNWQRLAMFGDITANATSYAGASGAATATSATSLTNTGAAFPTAGGAGVGGLQGHMVVSMAAGVPAVYGVIMSNTATVLTIDQWYSAASAVGAVGTTPTATAEYWVVPSANWVLWIGLSTNSAAAAAGDVLRTADGLFADGTTGAAATEQNANGLVRVYVPPTFPGAGQIQLQNTWTYTSSSPVTLAKAVLCNSKAAAGSLLVLETLLSAVGTVNASGDTIQATWTINL